jgi:hypothetical protein
VHIVMGTYRSQSPGRLRNVIHDAVCIMQKQERDRCRLLRKFEGMIIRYVMLIAVAKKKYAHVNNVRLKKVLHL